ncbi:MAG: aldo/keto reductase [Dehalococcoidales bacterium]|nr:aldo/keto reductase [Dehalococcoidales bacterium]
MKEININTTVKLNNGVEMPIFGLGTWQITGKEAELTVRCALDAGYRHIDTAAAYHNEEEVGKAIRESGRKREDIFITTKLWKDDLGYKSALEACNKSLAKLGLSYVDLYLIHWPGGRRLETWKAMEELLKTGKCRSVGVSNFTIRHLKQLMEDSSVIPAINQVEFSPYLYQQDLFDFCKASGIQLESYSPLTRGNKLNDAHLVSIANKYGKSTAQILIRWVLQLGIVVIPKAAKQEHIRQNADVFDFALSQEDMITLSNFNENLRNCWDPSSID